MVRHQFVYISISDWIASIYWYIFFFIFLPIFHFFSFFSDTEDIAVGNDVADDQSENDPTELQEDSKSGSNTQRLIADQPAFRDDKQSNFFPLLMFAMFIVVTFYVAYHNKSKILALLIEGRRRNSSRGGGRRKQHIEYRKLDSNLEEAIQSDGGHVLSTQIIY